jgi:hypothetical protein
MWFASNCASLTSIVSVPIPIHVSIPIEAHKVFSVLIAQNQGAAVGTSLVKDTEFGVLGIA